MASNPLKTLSQALTGTPDLPTAQAKAQAARQALIAAARQVDQAKVQLMVADEQDDPAAVQKAEAAVISTSRDADRASRQLQVAEDRLQRAEQAAEASSQAQHRKHLAELLAARTETGAQIESALVALEAGVKQLADVDARIGTVQTDVLGPYFVLGINCGKAALERHLGVEVAQRGILGQPSSMQMPRLAEWLSTGNDLLRQRV